MVRVSVGLQPGRDPLHLNELYKASLGWSSLAKGSIVADQGITKITVKLPAELVEALKGLSERTRVPQAAYFREAVEDLLKKYDAVPKQSSKSKRGGE